VEIGSWLIMDSINMETGIAVYTVVITNP